jgi:hypothetical protein
MAPTRLGARGNDLGGLLSVAAAWPIEPAALGHRRQGLVPKPGWRSDGGSSAGGQ